MAIKVARKIRDEIRLLNLDDVAPGQAALACSLADTLDETEAPTARAVVARELAACMRVLRALAPPVTKGDAVDDVGEQRKKRREEARRQLESG
ncbi:hypothetical protein [Streptomyces chryseus]